MEKTSILTECQVKTEEGLLTRNAENLFSQLWNMENTVSFLETLVEKLRSPESPIKDCSGKGVEPISIYEKYTHINDKLEILNKRLADVNQNLAEII